jgi:hypothetical protein
MKIPTAKILKKLFAFLLAALVVLSLLYAAGMIGVPRCRIEKKARAVVPPAWQAARGDGENLCALLFYSPDRSDCSDYSFNIYADRPGFSWGFFSRWMGSDSSIQTGITEYCPKEWPERIFLSMNLPGACRLEIDDGEKTRIIELDSNQPFALVLPSNGGTVTIYDKNGQSLEWSRREI